MKLCLYKSGFFCLFVCVCVCCAFMCALMYAHMCTSACTYGDPRMMLGVFFNCSSTLFFEAGSPNQTWSTACQFSQFCQPSCFSDLSLPSETGVADTTCRLHGSSGSELWSSCPASSLTKQPSHLAAHKSVSYFLFFDLQKANTYSYNLSQITVDTDSLK